MNENQNGKARERDVVPPIHLTSTYAVSWEEAEQLTKGNESVPFYARYGNPTVQGVEQQLTKLCTAPLGAGSDNYDALLTSSGMAAISLVPLGLLQAGDEIIATETIYGGTLRLLTETLPRFGINTRFVPCDLSGAAAVLTPATKMLLVESPANPINRLVSFQAAVTFARENGLISCIDATLAPPPLQFPLQFGFDLEVHSATKYFGGHSDLLAGAVIGKKEYIGTLRGASRIFGGVLDGHAAFLLGRGLHTLPLRLQQIGETSQRLARWLSEHPAVARVHYLGLESHEDHAAAQQQMPGGFGGIVAFDLAQNSYEAARVVVENLDLVRHAPSLGGCETLVSYPLLSSHAHATDDQLRRAGISRGTLRIAVGLEPAEEIEKDLERALSALAP